MACNIKLNATKRRGALTQYKPVHRLDTGRAQYTARAVADCVPECQIAPTRMLIAGEVGALDDEGVSGSATEISGDVAGGGATAKEFCASTAPKFWIA